MNGLHNTPHTAITKSNKMAVLLPLVSEIKLMIINPANEPIGKID